MARRKQPIIPDALLDQLLAGAEAKTGFDWQNWPLVRASGRASVKRSIP